MELSSRLRAGVKWFADTSEILECTEQIGHRLLALFRVVPWWLWAVVLVFLLLASMRERTLIVLPVSVPNAFVEAGYSPTAVSQAVAAHMTYVAGVGASAQMEALGVGPSRGGSPSFAFVGSGTPDLADIQIPGQQFSVRAVWRFVRGVFGSGDPTISISVGSSTPHYVVRATAVGGIYTGRRASTTVASSTPEEDVMLAAAALAVSVVQPLRYAVFLSRAENPDEEGVGRSSRCPVGISCTADGALVVVGNLLADDYLEDDPLAHLVYASLALAAGRTAEALQHCEESAAFEETRNWALINCSYSHLINGERSRAIATALNALPVRSDDPDVYAGFGDLFLDLDREVHAEDAYETALGLDERHVYSLVGLGSIDRRRERFAEAVEHYRAALLINPNEPYAHGGLGASLVGLGRAEDALFHLNQALDVDPTYQIAIDARAEARRMIELGAG